MKTKAIGLMMFVLISCSHEPKENVLLKPREFQSKLTTTTDVVLLDVRTPEELKQGYLKGAINFDFNAPEFNQLIAGMDKSKTYLVYCASGVRSNTAADKMRDMDFIKVYTLDGGIKAWKAEGLPVQEGK